MPEILSPAELLRLTSESTPSTRSSSPGQQSSYSTQSPTGLAGALSPPPPAHYLRNKARSEENGDASLKLLKKRSEIYDRDRDRSRRSVVTRMPHSSSAPDGLLFQQDLFRPSHLEVNNGDRTGLSYSARSPLISPLASPSKQWAFLETDPMGSSRNSIIRSPFARERDSLLLPRHRHSHSTEDSPLGQPSRLFVSMEPHAAISVDSAQSNNPNPGSSRGNLRDRDMGSTSVDTYCHSLSQFHRARKGSDSSMSISLSSRTSSSFFPPSLEPG